MDIEHLWYKINDSGWNIFTGQTEQICRSQPASLGLDGFTSYNLVIATQEHLITGHQTRPFLRFYFCSCIIPSRLEWK